VPELMLHVSRPVRWDSDHVTLMDDSTLELFAEIVRADALERVHYGLDYFDGAINRIGAYVIGSRAAQKCMLRAMLEPTDIIREAELEGNTCKVLTYLEEAKTMPWGDVYDEFCERNGVPTGTGYLQDISEYEKSVTSKR
ncbi:MAG: L-rhamnose isomerase, partial [Alistipes sp.]|nr:L-rhamnose isomerase [Candidatus Minthomonas equi]